MKFFIAAGILAHTLPAISEQSPSSELLTHDVDFGRVLANAANPAVKRTGRKKATNFQTRKAGRLLSNSPLASAGKICDPLSNDPDVGILSCDAGYQCVIDQASSMEGYCISTSRNLQSYYFCDLCGPGFMVGPGNLDNPVNVAGYDVATCGDMYDLAYYYYNNVTISDATCDVFAQAAKGDDCCTPFCKLCGFARNVAVANYDITLDLSAVGLGQSTCGDIFYSAYSLAAIDKETCPDVGQLAKDGGCCSQPPTYNCAICGGDGIFFENNVVISNGYMYYCGDVQPYLNPDRCASPSYITACCGVVTTVPTATPQEPGSPVAASPSMSPDMGMNGDDDGTSTTSPTDAPPPTSDSATMWSSCTLVSMMGLAAVSAGSLLVLN